jgi:hypothetical protein
MTSLKQTICPACGATNVGPHSECLLCRSALTEPAEEKKTSRARFGRVLALLVLILLIAAINFLPDWLKQRNEVKRKTETPLWQQWEQRVEPPEIPKKQGFKDLQDPPDDDDSQSLHEIFSR